jgi:hypothetical protein
MNSFKGKTFFGIRKTESLNWHCIISDERDWANDADSTSSLAPSMRRPVDVKAHFDFLLSVSLLPFSQAASVAILPSALFCERFSLGAHWVFSFQ